MTGIIYEKVDDHYLIAHTKYLLEFDYHGVASQVLSEIEQKKSTLQLQKLKNKDSQYVYDMILGWHQSRLPIISYKFTRYNGAIAVDFVTVPETTFNKLIQHYCIT